jgi:hypothetical protein
MNKLTIAASLLFSSAVLIGCGTDDGGAGDIDMSQTLSGTVGGQSWTFAAGETNAFLSEGEDDFFAELYPTAYTQCGFSAPTGDHLIVAIPKTPGEYEMNLGRNMTFVVGDSENLVSFEGKIVVSEVTATSVKGGLVGSYDGANEVNGAFELKICED